MKISNIFFAFTLSISLVSIPSFAKDRFDYLDAAFENTKDATIAATAATAAGQSKSAVQQMFTKPMMEKDIRPAVMTSQEIDKVMAQVNRMWNIGVGDLGGIQAEITFDGKQADAMNALKNVEKQMSALPSAELKDAAGKLQTAAEMKAGAVGDIRLANMEGIKANNMIVLNDALKAAGTYSPAMKTEVISLRTGKEALRHQLEELAKQGVMVSNIRLQSVAGKAVGPVMTGVVAVGTVASIERGVLALFQGMNSGVRGRSDFCGAAICEKPSFMKQVLSGAAGPAYDRDVEIAAEREIELAKRNINAR